MGLVFTDLESWERWERSQRPLRRVKAVVRQKLHPQPPTPFYLTSNSETPHVAAALDVQRGTSINALVEPVKMLEHGAILTRGPIDQSVIPAGWNTRQLEDLTDLPSTVRTVLSAGSYHAVSLLLHEVAMSRGLRFVVVQHGILTPFAVPLPPECELMAWNQAEADFWVGERNDIRSHAVGSQIIWKAAQRPAAHIESDQPLFLGQLHGTELPWSSKVKATESFCHITGALYRPHPGERGIRERIQHTAWKRRGFEFDESGLSLADIARPVASIFSTGILEAAARGLPAWGYHPQPPRWVVELWERHGIGRFGVQPTQVEASEVEPSKRIARLVSWP